MRLPLYLPFRLLLNEHGHEECHSTGSKTSRRNPTNAMVAVLILFSQLYTVLVRSGRHRNSLGDLPISRICSEESISFQNSKEKNHYIERESKLGQNEELLSNQSGSGRLPCTNEFFQNSGSRFDQPSPLISMQSEDYYQT